MSKPNKEQAAGSDDPLSLSMTDEEYDAMIKGFSDDELLAYMQNIRNAIEQNPEAYAWATQEMLDDIACKQETFRKRVRIAKEAQRQADIATAKVDRTADRYLAQFNEVDKSEGN